MIRLLKLLRAGWSIRLRYVKTARKGTATISCSCNSIASAEEGEGSHLTIAQAILVETALEEARKYIRGERSQGQMKLEAEETEVEGDEEPEAGEPGNLIAMPASS